MNIYLGTFETAVDAAVAYARHVKSLEAEADAHEEEDEETGHQAELRRAACGGAVRVGGADSRDAETGDDGVHEEDVVTLAQEKLDERQAIVVEKRSVFFKKRRAELDAEIDLETDDAEEKLVNNTKRARSEMVDEFPFDATHEKLKTQIAKVESLRQNFVKEETSLKEMIGRL